jgi:hypothetical protein
MAGATFGATSAFSDIALGLQGAAAESAKATVSVRELRDKFELDQRQARAEAEYIERSVPVPDMPYDIAPALRQEVLDKLDVKALARLGDERSAALSPMLDQWKELESQKLRLDGYLQSRDDLKLEDVRKTEQGKRDIDAQILRLCEQNHQLPQALYDVRKAEIDAPSPMPPARP